MSDLAVALAALQADLPPIKRTGRGHVGPAVGGRGYKYPEYPRILTTVRPKLIKHKFMWHTEPGLELIGGWHATLGNKTNLSDAQFVGEIRFVLRWELRHLPSGEAITGKYPLPEGPPQAMGGAISYAKRYALVAVLDLIVEGEDVDGAMDVPERRPVRGPRTGPDHERLRVGTVEATPEDRRAERWRPGDGPDPWADQPPETIPGSIDPDDRTKIMVLAKGMSRDKRLERVSTLAGRVVDSVNELSGVEAKMVVARWKS